MATMCATATTAAITHAHVLRSGPDDSGASGCARPIARTLPAIRYYQRAAQFSSPEVITPLETAAFYSANANQHPSGTSSFS